MVDTVSLSRAAWNAHYDRLTHASGSLAPSFLDTVLARLETATYMARASWRPALLQAASSVVVQVAEFGALQLVDAVRRYRGKKTDASCCTAACACGCSKASEETKPLLKEGAVGCCCSSCSCSCCGTTEQERRSFKEVIRYAGVSAGLHVVSYVYDTFIGTIVAPGWGVAALQLPSYLVLWI